MTEEEAKTKICCGPQTVAMVIGLAAPNLRAELTPDAGRCIASACMAWRTDRMMLSPLGCYEDAPAGSGHCGLAGDR